MNRVALLPVLFLTVCVVPLASAASWTLVFLLVPVLVAAWVLRTGVDVGDDGVTGRSLADRKSTRLNSSHANISYAVFCLKKKKESNRENNRPRESDSTA